MNTKSNKSKYNKEQLHFLYKLIHREKMVLEDAIKDHERSEHSVPSIKAALDKQEVFVNDLFEKTIVIISERDYKG
jgi:exonuclease VII small subunit